MTNIAHLYGVLIDSYRVEMERYINGERETHPRPEYIAHLMTLSLLPRLWASSTSLLIRFGAHPTVEQAAERMMDEVAELLEEAQKQTVNGTALAKEAADAYVTIVNLLHAAGVSQEQFDAALDAVMEKNDAKTHRTHRLHMPTQGVERIGRMPTEDRERLLRIQAAQVHEGE